MKSTVKMNLTMWTALLFASLYLLYRFYVEGMRLLPIGGVLLSSTMICQQLRLVVRGGRLRQSLAIMHWSLLAGTGVAVLYFMVKR
jgi:hypothetical protein